jgi:hypothetical protein
MEGNNKVVVIVVLISVSVLQYASSRIRDGALQECNGLKI